MLRRGNAWIEGEQRAAVARTMRPDVFAMTKPATRLFALAKKLTERPDMGIASGPSGIGKSTIVKALAAEIPSAILVTVTNGSRCTGGFMRATWNALQRRRRTREHRVTYDDVAEALKTSARVASRPLLIVDQAHRLHERVYQTLMDWHDECGISVLLVGTVTAQQRVTDDEDPEGGQLASRIGMRMDLTPEVYQRGGGTRANATFTVADVRRIFQRGKVRLSRDAEDLLCWIANESVGHLRRVERLVPWACSIARQRLKLGEDAEVLISADDVHQASRVVEGKDQASRLANRVAPTMPVAEAV
jgi:DNA transposition AAA+ family ATPase